MRREQARVDRPHEWFDARLSQVLLRACASRTGVVSASVTMNTFVTSESRKIISGVTNLGCPGFGSFGTSWRWNERPCPAGAACGRWVPYRRRSARARAFTRGSKSVATDISKAGGAECANGELPFMDASFPRVAACLSTGRGTYFASSSRSDYFCDMLYVSAGCRVPSLLPSQHADSAGPEVRHRHVGHWSPFTSATATVLK